MALADVASISGRELDPFLNCDPGLQLAAAFEFGIELDRMRSITGDHPGTPNPHH